MLMDVSSALISTGTMFVIGSVVLFLIYYFTSPLYTEYGDKRSRLYYSLFNALYFSIVLAILFLILPSLSESSGMLISLAIGLVIILASTLVHVYAINVLVRRGIIKIKQKRRIR
ncbi:conserved hypothetical protein [Methanocella paludicola SANAE]|uniref:Uncharacterized protein n=1 Tax=Methanocella paludicola (strain DSM 17711 / JCM 13418 / NBRC 101707 / SANAE) TaxID=304371 RepID=D1YUY0_METPS|nr:hypothetical protein [Methanocella paludicola]BAI60252.1 conserved hypothetical protein [Methanocella paludicola SANAE]